MVYVLESLFLFITLCSGILLAQQPEPHSLGIGIQNGFATVGDYELNTPALTLNLNHQRNFSKLISWRNSLQGTYILPVKNMTMFPAQNYTLIQKVQSTHFALVSTPLIYYRDEGFRLFAGLGGGAGLQLEKYVNSTAEIGELEGEDSGGSSYTYITLGWKPMLGLGMDIGGRKSGNELEISLSYESWWQVMEGGGAEPFYWWGLQFTYRHNFAKG